MKTLELFSGTKSFSRVMAKNSHSTITIDNDCSLGPDICGDVRNLNPLTGFQLDIVWASPPCQGFSVASIGKNWNYDNTPKTESAKLGMELAKAAISFIEDSKVYWWFIENPRGKLRKMSFMEEFLARTGGVRHTVTYCQYGDTRMKPTDIWTNALWWKPRPVCKNGAKCHEAAPRGSKTGTQGIDGAKDRGRIPAEFMEEIIMQLK